TSTHVFKDSVEVLTFIPNILGAPEMWHPISYLERSFKYVQMTSALFLVEAIDKSKDKYKYTLDPKIAGIKSEDYSLLKTLDGEDFIYEGTTASGIERDVIHLSIHRDYINVTGGINIKGRQHLGLTV